MPADALWRFWLNPASPFIQLFQDIIKDGIWAHLHAFMTAAASATASLGVGYATFKCGRICRTTGQSPRNGGD